jgi:hypothetical protein
LHLFTNLCIFGKCLTKNPKKHARLINYRNWHGLNLRLCNRSHLKNSYKMKRRELIEELEELLSDEFDSSELVYLTKKELIRILISTAKFYKYEQD